MNTHLIIPAIASLVLFSANPASASSPTSHVPRGVETLTRGQVFAGSQEAYRQEADMYSRAMRGRPAPVILALNDAR